MTDRLLIIDDDPGITSALARGLAMHGYTAETANRADVGLARLTGEPFAGAIVDVMLGEDSGIELVRAARSAGISVPILMLSALSDVEHRAAGLEAGADDYVVKPFSFDELVARLRVQAHRAEARAPRAARFNARTRILSFGSNEAALTEREAALLLLLIETGETPLPRGEIFDRLWAADGSGTENVVDVYIGYVRKKLAGHDFGFSVKTIRNRGFCIDGNLPELI